METDTADITIRQINSVGCNEYYITLGLAHVEPEKIPEHIGELYRYIKSHGIHVVHESYYGHTEHSNYLLSSRNELMAQYAIDEPPLLYLEGKPACGSSMAGIMLYGIETSGESDHDAPTLERVYDAGDLVGTLVRRKDSDELYLMSLTGCGRHDAGSFGFIDETRKVYRRMTGVLSRYGFSIQDIVRTTFFVRELLENYDRFNQCREEFFRSCAGDLTSYPASTCIMGNSLYGDQIVANVIAVKNKSHLEIRPVKTGKQCEAPEYGSLFSRATLLTSDGFSRLYVSGTASINRNGESVFLGSPRDQIIFTIECVEELLKNSGMAFSDIVTSAVYLKRKEDFPVFQEIRKESAINNMPMACAIADICRDELLFEMDLIAHKVRSGGTSLQRSFPPNPLQETL